MENGGRRDHRNPLHDPPASRSTAVVVVGVDGSDPSWDAICWACGEARRLGGRIIAAFVGPTSAAASATASASVVAGAVTAYGAIQQMIADEAEQLRGQVRTYADDHGVDLTFIHTTGDAAKELLRIADANHADVIVVGRSTKARHHVAGSLGRRLVGRRDAPIIVVVP